MTKTITFDPRAQRATTARQLRAHAQAVAVSAGPPSVVAEAVRLALWLFPAMLVFVSVMGV